MVKQIQFMHTNKIQYPWWYEVSNEMNTIMLCYRGIGGWVNEKRENLVAIFKYFLCFFIWISLL